MTFRLADNRLAEEAEWDDNNLAYNFQVLMDEGYDLSFTGFEAPEIDLVFDHAVSTVPENSLDELPVTDEATPVVTRRSDLWYLDGHRLLCGDARESDDYTVLLDGQFAQMVFTDSPFNVKVSGHIGGKGKIKHEEFAMASGEMSSKDFAEFLEAYITNVVKFSDPTSIHFHCMDWRHIRLLETICLNHYKHHLNTCIWVKDNGGMGSLYRSQHEMVLVVKPASGTHINNVQLGKYGRNRTNVWEYAGVNTFNKERRQDLAMHPTVKPVTMVADAIRDCSKRNGIILDPFCGSGTTIIAAEETGRRGYGIEFEPHYVDVSIRRWQKLTGQDAIHAASGKTFNELEKELEEQGRVIPKARNRERKVRHG
jgi:DNA modification methylase